KVGSQTAYEFSDDDLRVFRAMARRASGLIAGAQLLDRLRRSEAQLRAVVDNAPAMIYLKDPEGRYLLVNRYAESVFGHPEKDILGRTDAEVLPGPVAAQCRAYDRRVIEGKAAVFAEEVVPLHDGAHTYWTVKFPLLDAAGTLFATGGISSDITERKG